MRIECSRPCNISGVCLARKRAARRESIPVIPSLVCGAVKMLFHPFISLRLLVAHSLLSFIFALGYLLKVIPFFRCFLIRAFDAAAGETLSPSIYWDALFGKEMLENIWHSVVIDTQKKAKLGCNASNPTVITPDGKHCFPLLNMSTEGRPLILNFGSCTCPIFMNRLKDFRRLVEDFGHVADFLVVYIEEAHPADGWAFKNNYNILSHRLQSERCEAAHFLMSQHPGCPVVVDTMHDAANTAYGAMPIRLNVVQDGKLVYDGGAGPMGYRLQDLRLWLHQFTARRTL